MARGVHGIQVWKEEYTQLDPSSWYKEVMLSSPNPGWSCCGIQPNNTLSLSRCLPVIHTPSYHGLSHSLFPISTSEILSIRVSLSIFPKTHHQHGNIRFHDALLPPLGHIPRRRGHLRLLGPRRPSLS